MKAKNQNKASKIAAIAVFVVVLLFGIGQFFAGANLNNSAQTSTQNSTSTNSNQLTTQVVAYAPPGLDSTLPVEKGSCFSSSVSAPYRTDAWRCTVGNAISDPCFEISGATSSLLCGVNPASTDISSEFVLNLTKPLPKPILIPGTPPANWAWFVELGDGTICTPFTGTRPFAATGEVATYSCNGPSATESLIFGDLNDATSTWIAEIGSLSTSTAKFPPPITASTTIPVFAVWQ